MTRYVIAKSPFRTDGAGVEILPKTYPDYMRASQRAEALARKDGGHRYMAFKAATAEKLAPLKFAEIQLFAITSGAGRKPTPEQAAQIESLKEKIKAAVA
jgi:hypothetical protein